MRFFKGMVLIIVVTLTGITNAANHYVSTELTIKFIRSVGNYSTNMFDDTIELHFTTPIPWPNGIPCTNTARVMIDASKANMISAAYTAYTAGMKVRINADDTLPIRGGACELSFLDIVK